MKILFYFAHPAQYLFLRATIKNLSFSSRHQLTICIKSKDVLEDLVTRDQLPYKNILNKERGVGLLNIIVSLIRRNLIFLKMLIKERHQLLISTDASLAQVGWLLQIPRITVLEDDYDVIKNLARLTYPFTNTILCPDVCDVGNWTAKKVGYSGYMKLGYLHPSIFSPDIKIIEKYDLPEKYALIRLSALRAHHDQGIAGLSDEQIEKAIVTLVFNGFKVCITSENDLRQNLKSYALKIDPSDMHHVLAFSSMLISDSQSMSVEAAMLGVPSIRYSDFAGKISVLEELEHVYKLTFGIATNQPDKLSALLNNLLDQNDIKSEFQRRRMRMLAEKINVTTFLTWLLENYPMSISNFRNAIDGQLEFE